MGQPSCWLVWLLTCMVTMLRLYTHTQNNYSNKWARINIDPYHTAFPGFLFETIFNQYLFYGKNPCVDVGIDLGDAGDVGSTSSVFCSHPIVPGIFTNILGAGAFSPICLINPEPIGWYVVWWLNHIPKVCGVIFSQIHTQVLIIHNQSIIHIFRQNISLEIKLNIL